jgi:hypothetical protein
VNDGPGASPPERKRKRFISFIDLAGEEAGTGRAEAHESDSQFFEHGQDLCFRTSGEDGVLALDGGDRLDRGAALRGGALA